MTVVINGTSGITDVNGSAAAPAITGTDTDTGVFFGTNTVSLSTNGTERLQIDSSGNAGLGVTPKAWSVYKAIDLNTYGAIGATTGALSILGNAYYNGTNYIYKANSEATAYDQVTGQHRWSVAASGTAGNTISFTQAMTLDASGNLGVGTTSIPNYTNYKTLAVGGSVGGVLDFIASNIGSGTNRAAQISADSSSNLVFSTGASNSLAERARIDSGGNLLVGITSGTARGAFIQDGTGSSIQTGQTNTSFTGNAVNIRATRNTSNGTYNFIGCAREGVADVLFVRDSGNVVNANNSYGAISDIKLKENISDATPKLAGLMQVRVVNYNFKNEPEHKQLGVIAQEIEQVFPAMVEETIDRDSEGNDLGTTTKSVKYSVFVPMLIKAIQEQQAIITQLQADVAALKGQA